MQNGNHSKRHPEACTNSHVLCCDLKGPLFTPTSVREGLAVPHKPVCELWGYTSSAMQTLVKWWAEYPGELLEARVVKPLQQYLTDELVVTKKLTVSVMNTIKVLAKVEEANQLGRLLPPDAFYNQLIRCCTCCRAGAVVGFCRVWHWPRSGHVLCRELCFMPHQR